MCDYCENIQQRTNPWDSTPRLWFKTFPRPANKVHICLFYRSGDENPWYISTNGSLTQITECPMCHRDLSDVRYFLLVTKKYVKADTDKILSDIRKAYSKKFYRNMRSGVLMPIDEEDPYA